MPQWLEIPAPVDGFQTDVTGDSGITPESVTFNRKRRSCCSGICGHVPSESVVAFGGNTQGVTARRGVSLYGVVPGAATGQQHLAE